jgi:mRNA interferase MazF
MKDFMATIQPGESGVANVIFMSGGGWKKRPILILLVLWLDGDDVVAAVVTSGETRTETDIPILLVIFNKGDRTWKFYC